MGCGCFAICGKIQADGDDKPQLSVSTAAPCYMSLYIITVNCMTRIFLQLTDTHIATLDGQDKR